MLVGVVSGVALLVPAFPAAALEAEAVVRRREELQRQLKELERKIQEQAQLVARKQQERISLERDLEILDAQIARARLALQRRDLYIKELDARIADKLQTVAALADKLEREKAALAHLLRRAYMLQDATLVEVALSNNTLSEFFRDLDAIAQIKRALQQSFADIRATQAAAEDARRALERARAEQVELRRIQELQKREIEEQEERKRRLLTLTKGQERAYRSLLERTQKTAAQIRAELFALRDSRAIPFGKAVAYATKAGELTGVRPALILAVLKQETKLGEFIGTGTWRRDMHPTRDRPLFRVITATLGYDPDRMPVSAQPGYGWGGAMGPAQFIPSTWACYGGYINERTGDCNNRRRTLSWKTFWAGPWRYSAAHDRIRQLLRLSRPSDPWQPQDAILAAALLLRANGAAEGTRTAERLAALRYFAGWSNAKNPAYAFYGDSVMRYADEFQRLINVLVREG